MTPRLLRHYVGHPLHILVLLASLALSGYAALTLFSVRPIAVAVWFVGAAIGHDVVLLPLYSLIDRGLLLRRRTLPSPPWLNHVRFPAAISLLLLLVFLPQIARLSDDLTPLTALNADRYFVNWLAITGALFLLSALAYAYRLRTGRQVAAVEDEN